MSMSIVAWLKDHSKREWQLTDDVEIKEVVFEDGLLSINLGKVVPEHHARKDYL